MQLNLRDKRVKGASCSYAAGCVWNSFFLSCAQPFLFPLGSLSGLLPYHSLPLYARCFFHFPPWFLFPSSILHRFAFFLRRFTLLPLCFSLLFSIQLLHFYLFHFTVSAANCFLNLYHFSSLSFYSLLRFFFPVLERVFLFSYVSV